MNERQYLDPYRRLFKGKLQIIFEHYISQDSSLRILLLPKAVERIPALDFQSRKIIKEPVAYAKRCESLWWLFKKKIEFFFENLNENFFLNF